MKRSNIHLRRAIARMMNLSHPRDYITEDHPFVYRHLNLPVPKNREMAHKTD